MLVDSEQWSQAEVPVDFQNIIDYILQSSTSSATAPISQSVEQLIRRTEVEGSNESLEDGDGDLGGATMALDKGSKASLNNTKSVKYLVVDGQTFYVVGCLLMFLKMLTDYLSCIDYIPGLYNDVLNRILDILKVNFQGLMISSCLILVFARLFWEQVQ